MNKNKYILTIDQGTTSTRTIIFDYRGTIVTKSQMEFSQICPKNGWVEHNPEEIWELTLQTIKNAINSINLKSQILRPLVLQIKGRPLFFGIKKQVDRFIMLLYGNLDNHKKYVIL